MESAAEAPTTPAAARAPRTRPGVFTVVLVFLAVLMTALIVAFGATERLLAWDVRFAYLPATEAVINGDSPYPAVDDPILEDQKGYVYPPQLLLALVPLTPLQIDLAAVLVTVALVAMLLLTLRILGIDDVRCYAAALLWVPSVSALLLGNVSIPLAFALAVAWRFRDTMWKPAWALALAVSAKLLVWPVLVWMAATGRWRQTVWSVLIGVGLTFGAWAVIGFDGLASYPDLLRRLSEIQAHRSYSFVGMASTLGLGETAGTVLGLAVGGALLVSCVVLARRGDDRRSFTCAVAATLALSPIVWLHYLVLLLVPLAIMRPRFSAIWLLPVLLWVSPKPGYAEGVLTFAPAIVAVILLVAMLRGPSAHRADAAVA
jgi:hypothetical protein